MQLIQTAPEREPVVAANRRVELPGVAAVVAPDEQPFLTMTAVSGVNPGRLHDHPARAGWRICRSACR